MGKIGPPDRRLCPLYLTRPTSTRRTVLTQEELRQEIARTRPEQNGQETDVQHRSNRSVVSQPSESESPAALTLEQDEVEGGATDANTDSYAEADAYDIDQAHEQLIDRLGALRRRNRRRFFFWQW